MKTQALTLSFVDVRHRLLSYAGIPQRRKEARVALDSKVNIFHRTHSWAEMSFEAASIILLSGLLREHIGKGFWSAVVMTVLWVFICYVLLDAYDSYMERQHRRERLAELRRARSQSSAPSLPPRPTGISATENLFNRFAIQFRNADEKTMLVVVLPRLEHALRQNLQNRIIDRNAAIILLRRLRDEVLLPKDYLIEPLSDVTPDGPVLVIYKRTSPLEIVESGPEGPVTFYHVRHVHGDPNVLEPMARRSALGGGWLISESAVNQWKYNAVFPAHQSGNPRLPFHLLSDGADVEMKLNRLYRALLMNHFRDGELTDEIIYPALRQYALEHEVMIRMLGGDASEPDSDGLREDIADLSTLLIAPPYVVLKLVELAGYGDERAWHLLGRLTGYIRHDEIVEAMSGLRGITLIEFMKSAVKAIPEIQKIWQEKNSTKLGKLTDFSPRLNPKDVQDNMGVMVMGLGLIAGQLAFVLAGLGVLALSHRPAVAAWLMPPFRPARNRFQIAA